MNTSAPDGTELITTLDQRLKLNLLIDRLAGFQLQYRLQRPEIPFSEPASCSSWRQSAERAGRYRTAAQADPFSAPR